MTRVLTRTALPLAVLFFVLLAMAGCRGGEETDLTAGEISDNQLPLMLLSLEDFGPDFRDYELEEDSGPRTAADMADDDFDPEDEALDIERFGWASGYERSYLNGDAARTRSGIFASSSDVNLFDTADGAAGYLDDLMVELEALPGKTSGGFTLAEARQFDADAADEAAGFYFSGSVQADDGSQVPLFSTGIILRRGRLLGSVGFVSFDRLEAEEQLKGLALMLDQRIIDVLKEEAQGEQGSEPLVMRPGAVLITSGERFTQQVETSGGRSTPL